MRLAWFSPWPPQSSGVAGRSAELVPLLAHAGHGVDVFVDDRAIAVAAASRAAATDAPQHGEVRLQSAHDFVWRAERHQYDLVIYQAGNSREHDFIWPYLFRWPGLTVFHDARIHHARGQALLLARRAGAYRAEFAWNHPDVPVDAAELAIAGFDGAYYYMWPMTGAVVAASRRVAAHSRGGAAELQAACPDRPVDYIALGEGRRAPMPEAERDAARAALGLASSDVAFGVFGALTPEKRIAQVLRAFRTTLTRVPHARLVLAGAAGPDSPWPAMADELGVGAAVTWRSGLDDREFERAIAAVDIVINLRWPSAMETSGPWLRALAASRPTIVTDLAHQAHVPVLDPRTWQASNPGDTSAPIAVAIDLLDEDHSLGLAMRRLADDAPLRARLGHAGRTYWEREHTVERMAADYLALIAAAAADHARRPLLPDALVSRPDARLRALLSPFGNLSCDLY